MDNRTPSRLEGVAYTMTPKAAKTARKYTGDTAAGYDKRRKGQEKWTAEQRIIAGILEMVREGSSVLDVPVGTGRFFELYAGRGFDVTGMDISRDMLEKADQERLRTGTPVILRKGNIFDLDCPNRWFNLTLAIRIMNLIAEQDMQQALRELQRVTHDMIVFNLRVDQGNSKYRNPQKMSAVKDALLKGWAITGDQEIHEPDFRMITLSCVG